MLKIGIVSVNFNGEKDSLELLEDLKDLKAPGFEVKIIFVDNASSDNFVEIASKKYPEIDILQNGVNKGFSGGYNRGMSHALLWGADYVLIINNDALTPDKKLLTSLLSSFEKNPKAAIVAPKIYFAPGFEFHKDRYKKEDEGKVVWFAGGAFDWNNIMSIHRGIDEVDRGEYSGEMEMDFATGCCFLISREALEKVGMFDEEYFAYFEDADLSKRIIDAGYKIIINANPSIYHKVSQSTGTGSVLTDYYLTRNRLIFGFKYARRRTKFALWREAMKQAIYGRLAQRDAVEDYFGGKFGAKTVQKWNSEAKYQVDLSVISVNFNTPELIGELLKSIKKFNLLDSSFRWNDNFEVLILDNGSDRGCEEVVAKFRQSLPVGARNRLRFIQNETNEGFTGGNNKLFKFSRGRYILMLNSDIEVMEGSLAEIYKQAESYKENAVVSGSLVFPDGTQQDSVFDLPTITGAIKEYLLGIKGSFFMYVPSQNEHSSSSSKNTRVQGAAMACFMIPRKILEKVGNLDERLFTYFEDVDFCRRCLKLGIPIYYTPSAKFIHQHGATGKTLKQGRAYELLQNAAKIYYGAWYYRVLSLTLRILQKISWVKTPVAR